MKTLISINTLNIPVPLVYIYMSWLRHHLFMMTSRVSVRCGYSLVSPLGDKFILFSNVLFVCRSFSLVFFSCSPFHTFLCSFIPFASMLISFMSVNCNVVFFCLFIFSVGYHYVIASCYYN